LRDNAPVGPRCKKLAFSKIKQVNDTIQRSRRLTAVLEHLLHCQCPSLQVCVQRLSLSPELRKLRPIHGHLGPLRHSRKTRSFTHRVNT
jgi:hypothetical protein